MNCYTKKNGLRLIDSLNIKKLYNFQSLSKKYDVPKVKIDIDGSIVEQVHVAKFLGV